ncbi:MAG: hypothetical protein RLZZ58_785 [Pseudomonadota bacterium]
MMKLDPRAMQVFLAVCRAGSISGAARDLNLSQPSVSVAVAQLERALGTILFERKRTGIILSAAGIALERRAEAIDSLIAGARREIDLLAVNVAGPLTIGGTPGALATLVPGAVAAFRQAVPHFQLRILERPDAELHAMLRARRIDLAVVTVGLEGAPDDLSEVAVAQDPFDLIVGQANDALPATVSLHDLTGLPWVLPDAVGAFRRQIDALFVAAQVPTPLNVIRCDSLLTTKAIVQHSDYVTILPRAVAAAELSVGVLRAARIREAAFLRQVGVLSLRDAALSPAAEAFLAHATRAPNP